MNKPEKWVRKLRWYAVAGPAAVFAAAVCIDQALKQRFEGVQPPNPKPLFFFAEEINRGFAFSLPFRTSLWVGGLIVFFLLLALYLWHQRTSSMWMAYAVAFLFAGGAGNVWDRLQFGGVRDFIQIRDLTAFNLADIWVLIGLALLAYREYQAEHTAHKNVDA